MSSISKRKKRQLLARDGIRIDDIDGYQVAYIFRCYLCLKRFKPFQLQIEHKIPRGRGGTSTLDNLGLACEPCNIEKANMTLDEYLEWRELPEKWKLASMKYQGRRRLNEAKRGLTHALSEYWPNQESTGDKGR